MQLQFINPTRSSKHKQNSSPFKMEKHGSPQLNHN